MRLNGSFTVESAVIFPIFTIIVIMFIRFDFRLHDALINDVGKIMGGLRYLESESFYYDIETENLNATRIAESPVLGKDSDNSGLQRAAISVRVQLYFNSNRLGNEVGLSTTGFDEVIDCGSNAARVRSGGRVVQVIGG